MHKYILMSKLKWPKLLKATQEVELHWDLSLPQAEWLLFSKQKQVMCVSVCDERNVCSECTWV